MVEGYLTVLVSTQITTSMFPVHQFNKKFKKTVENKDPFAFALSLSNGNGAQVAWIHKLLKTRPESEQV